MVEGKEVERLVLARYAAPEVRRSLLMIAAWQVAILAAMAAIVWQLANPTPYVASASPKYFPGLLAAAIATSLIVPKLYRKLLAYRSAKSGRPALVVHEGKLYSDQWPAFDLLLNDINSATIQPADRIGGAPERLKIALASGPVRRVDCDLLDRSARDLIEALNASRAGEAGTY